jgi:hypothetical protein
MQTSVVVGQSNDGVVALTNKMSDMKDLPSQVSAIKQHLQ